MSILLVTGIHAGVGASTVAANLAAAYTVLGHKVLLVDLDPKNLVGPWFGHPTDKASGWTDAVSSDQSWKQALLRDPIGSYFLPHGGSLLTSSEYARYLDEMLTAARDKFEIIIISAPHDIELSLSLTCSLLTLRVVNPTPMCVTLLSRQMALSPPDSNILFVLNQCRHDIALLRDMTLVLEEALGTRLISAHLYYDIAIQEAFAMLGNVMTAATRSNAAVEFRQLATVVLSQVEKNQLRS
ncbi:cellulose synthase operon protein YhjQ/BcsQ [Vibrio variabilis]|uniref:cellulose synthase operon protein YhjQ/BcsQ n=1 Tax=Vibrio variabilis TaxID=990271 RepID=UPI000DD5B287|nr:cellulose synthase operon protein YhjQ/BcsQ [Vibrio variabilis]